MDEGARQSGEEVWGEYFKFHRSIPNAVIQDCGPRRESVLRSNPMPPLSLRGPPQVPADGCTDAERQASESWRFGFGRAVGRTPKFVAAFPRRSGQAPEEPISLLTSNIR